VFLDIASTRNNLGNMLQYLKEGLYFDSMTRSVTAQAVTYNANLKQLANVVVMFNFTDAGAIDVTHKVNNMNIAWYTEFNDANGDGVNDGSVQLGCEIILAIMFAYAAMLELSELIGAMWDESSFVRGCALHFSNLWNIVDAANIALQLMSISTWISYQALRRSKLAPLLRYDVYGKYFPITTFRLPDCPYSYQKGLPSALTRTHYERLTPFYFTIRQPVVAGCEFPASLQSRGGSKRGAVARRGRRGWWYHRFRNRRHHGK